jgi:hypothetical protein
MIVAHLSALPGKPSSADLDPNLQAFLPIVEIEPAEKAPFFGSRGGTSGWMTATLQARF